MDLYPSAFAYVKTITASKRLLIKFTIQIAMNAENFDPKESLLLIESMINRAKDKFAEDGSMYLLWGWIVFICSLTQFILLHFFQSPYHYMVWLLSWLVFIYQIIYMRRKTQATKGANLYWLYSRLCMDYFCNCYFSPWLFNRAINNR